MNTTKPASFNWLAGSANGGFFPILLLAKGVILGVVGLLSVLSASVGAEPPVVRAGSELEFRPYCFTDEAGQPTGFGVSLLRAVAGKMGLQLGITPGPWDTVWNQLVAGELDVLPVVARTPGREPLVDFSVPHTETFDAFFVSEGRPWIKDLAGAAGKEIVVLRSDAAHHQLIERKFTGKIIAVESIPDGLRLIAQGKHDALLCSRLIGVLEREQAGIKGVQDGPVIPDYKRTFSFAVSKGHPELLQKLNQGLRLVQASGEYDQLYRKWLGLEKPPPPLWQQYFWPVLGMIAVLALLVVAWRISREAAKWDDRLLRVLAPRRFAALPAASRYTLAIVIILAATALRMALLPSLGRAAPHNLALVATLGVTVLLGIGPGLVTAVLGDILVEVFVLESWPVMFQASTLTRMGFTLAIEGGAVFVLHAARVAAVKAQDNAKRLQTQRERMPIGLIVYDTHDCFSEVNPAAERIFGYTAAELQGKHANILVPPAVRPHVENIMRRLAQGEMTAHSVNENVTKDGRTILCDWTNTPLRDGDGKFLGCLCMIQDVTERKRAHEALRQSEERFRVAQELAPDGFSILRPLRDDHGRAVDFAWVYENATAARFTGSEPGSLIGRRLLEAFPGHKGSEFFKVYQEVAETRERRVFEAHYAGETVVPRWFRVAVVPVGEDIAVLAQDISKAKEFQTELERLVAERTAKLQEMVAELEHFSYTITHDMRAPLRAIQGFAGMMLEACADCEENETKGFLRRIETSAARMDLLITDALNYSRTVRQELALAPVDVAALLRGMLDSYPEFQPSRADIRVQGAVPSVIANEAGLTQCFSNLLGNAVKFVKPGQKPAISIRAERRDGWVRIWIEDNGIGIPEPMLPRVFDMFARGHNANKYEGSGIGLALVRKVMDRMDGKVGVESEQGKGSRFWLDLKPANSKAG